MDLSNIIPSIGNSKKGKLKKEWEFQADSPLLAPPVVGNSGNGKNLIFFGTKNGKVYSLDDQSKVKWLYDIQEKRSQVELLFLDEETVKSIRSPPVLADINGDGKQEVIVCSDNGFLYVLTDGGKLLWEFNAKAPIKSSAIACDINKDKKLEIIFGCCNNKVYSLDSKGKLLWSFGADSPVESIPAVILKDKPQIIFGTNSGSIFSLDASGKQLWKFKTEGKITAQAVISDLLNDGNLCVIVGSLDNYLYCLTEHGTLSWRFKTEGSIYSKACVADINADKSEEIIFGSCDNNVYALDSNGQKIWSFETDFWVVASPTVIDIDEDGKLEVVVGSYDHSLYVLDAEGTFILNYMPGLSGIAQQPGHYAGIVSSQPGHYQGKKLWEYKTDSFIVGSAFIDEKGSKKILIGTKKGYVDLFKHEK
jgi:outer membrane protein assembly factor BamB